MSAAIAGAVGAVIAEQQRRRRRRGEPPPDPKGPFFVLFLIGLVAIGVWIHEMYFR